MSDWRRTAWEVPEGDAGERLDQWMARQPGAPTRSQLKAAADEGRVEIAGKSVRASQRVRAGDRVELLEAIREASGAAPTGEAIDLDVLYEDDAMLAVNKPAGMVVHPAAGNRSGTLVHALLYRNPDLAWPGEADRAGIVHRLDRDTSGVILVAKSVRAHEALSRQFRDRTIRKTYLALVHGLVRSAGTIDLPIGRHPTERKRMSVAGRPARAAFSEYRPIEHFAAFTLLEVKPRTGRTHQIRVHLSTKGMPIVGDKVYGGKNRSSFPRQALHAAAIELERPDGGGHLRIEAPLAADIEALLATLRAASPDPAGGGKGG